MAKFVDPFSFAEYAAHGDELQHLFDTSIMIPPDTDPGLLKLSAEDEEFSKNFVKLWVSFATHGLVQDIGYQRNLSSVNEEAILFVFC